MFPATKFRGKRVGLFGLARSGTACAEALRLGGAEVLAWDDSSEAVVKAGSLPIVNLRDVDFGSLEALVLSPGVPLTHPKPHWTVEKARAAGIEIIGDTEVFAREIAGTAARMVAVTGTNGKSTTTALIGHVLNASGLDAEVGGNIGTAVFLMRPPAASRVYVLELSSFQIDLMPSLKPDIGILTNITPDHLDRHGTIEHYADVKARMFARQTSGDTALIGVDDPWGEAIAARVPHARRVSVERSLADGLSATDGILRDVQSGKQIASLDLGPMASLKGAHNWQNACMAYGSARALGLDVAQIEMAMKTFPGLQHRMQQIATRRGVAFVNDSKATNADAAAKALASFDNIHWIAGGIAKSGGIAPLAPFFPRIRKAYLIGEAAPDFAATLAGKVSVDMSGTLDAAVAHAARDAEPGSVVLLSPACASFDHYPNFEVRGDAFVKLVATLSGIDMTDLGGT
jgi:UDP-N-acetylmuramoylalanine--D-glutamate ligase